MNINICHKRVLFEKSCKIHTNFAKSNHFRKEFFHSIIESCDFGGLTFSSINFIKDIYNRLILSGNFDEIVNNENFEYNFLIDNILIKCNNSISFDRKDFEFSQDVCIGYFLSKIVSGIYKNR